MTQQNNSINPLYWIAYMIRSVDPYLLVIMAGLLGYAWLMMTSVSPDRIVTQQIYIALAVCCMWLVAMVPFRYMISLAIPLYFIGVVLLIAVDLFGDVSKGARRWLDLGFIRIQPSEIMKIAMPMMLAWYFQQCDHVIRWREFIIALLLLAFPLWLILMQPDLGTAVLVAASGVFVLFFAGLSWKLILPFVLIGVIGAVGIVGFGDTLCQPALDWVVLHDYQKLRICTLLDPSQDPLGKGFHIIQSMIAIGSGGVYGKGLMAGTQAHLSFVPERHTDFIFSVLAEEFGLIGSVILLCAYLLLVFRGLVIALSATTVAGRLLAGAISMIFFTYAFVNMGMVSGILPVVGVPLPFISYGGTALVTLCMGVGILMSIRNSSVVARTEKMVQFNE